MNSTKDWVKTSNEHAESIKDVNQLGLYAALGSLGYVFWARFCVVWVLEAAIVPSLDTLAREMLHSEGMSRGLLDQVPQGSAHTKQTVRIRFP